MIIELATREKVAQLAAYEAAHKLDPSSMPVLMEVDYVRLSFEFHNLTVRVELGDKFTTGQTFCGESEKKILNFAVLPKEESIQIRFLEEEDKAPKHH